MKGDTMNGLTVTRRGYLVIMFLSLTVAGFVGWLENL
jgi:hypothetical protein